MRRPASIFSLPLFPTLATCLALAGCSKADSGGDRPMRTTVETSRLDVAGVVSASRETRTIEPVTDEPTSAPKPEDPERPQSGQITAGDTDDLLNPEQYARYAGRFLQQGHDGLPFVDARTRVAIRIVDAAGRPVPHAKIDVSRPGTALRLVSAADGTASFYPTFDDVGSAARISVASDAGTASRTLQIGKHGRKSVTLTVPGQGRPVGAMDLVIVLDTTGSMGDEMAYLQSELDTIVARLKRYAGNLALRIGLVLYRDEGDDYVTRSFPLASDMGSVRATLADQSANGGGDAPEAVDRALIAAERMQWRPEATKALLLIADAPPHQEALKPTMEATERLRAQGVQIVPVAASGVEDSAQYVMRTMALLTQGRYIFLTDDSGIGNAHAEPDVACYVVTRLDQLIARVLAGLVQGRRIEPGQTEVIRTVGDYDNGRCRIAQDGGQGRSG